MPPPAPPQDKEKEKAELDAARMKREAEDKDHIGPRFRPPVNATAMDPKEQAKAKLRVGLGCQGVGWGVSIMLSWGEVA